MERTFVEKIYSHHRQCGSCPTTGDISKFFDKLLGLLFPNFSSKPIRDMTALSNAFDASEKALAILADPSNPARAAPVAAAFFEHLPAIYDLLETDLSAIYEGDPAALNREEVVRTYPGFYAIAAYRVAHRLRSQGVRLIPRSITEYAHSKTGIDIHPGATIGKRFCIDHGTGVVIGETTIIGEDVKIYQGVTLGALSVHKKLTNVKRHPTIGDRVVIYAGATVLGGQTHVGSDSIVGGSVWLTQSVPPHSRVYYKAPNGLTVF